MVSHYGRQEETKEPTSTTRSAIGVISIRRRDQALVARSRQFGRSFIITTGILRDLPYLARLAACCCVLPSLTGRDAMEEETTLAEIAQQLACLAAVLRELADKPLFEPVANDDNPAQDDEPGVAN